MNNEIDTLKLNEILSIIFILIMISSLVITHNSLLRTENKKPLFSSELEDKLNLINKFLLLIIVIGFLYLNYEDCKIKKKNLTMQLTPSILALISAIIVLKIALDDYQEKASSPSLGNPFI